MSKLIDEIRFTQELIKIPSITPRDLGAMNVVTKHLKKLGFKCKLMSFQKKGTEKELNRIITIGYLIETTDFLNISSNRKKELKQNMIWCNKHYEKYLDSQE